MLYIMFVLSSNLKVWTGPFCVVFEDADAKILQEILDKLRSNFTGTATLLSIVELQCKIKFLIIFKFIFCFQYYSTSRIVHLGPNLWIGYIDI